MRAIVMVALTVLLGLPGLAAADCADGESVTGRVLCRADRAVAADSLDPCDAAADVRVRDQCYGVFAVRKGRADACRSIPDTDRRGRSLRQICLSDVAIVTGNGELCGEIDHAGLRDTCHLKLYRDTGDERFCERIGSPALRGLCDDSRGEPID